jgi:hypothetical protein
VWNVVCCPYPDFSGHQHRPAKDSSCKWTDSQIVVRRVPRRVTEIAETTSESVNSQEKELDRTVSVVMGHSENPRTGCYHRYDPPSTNSSIWLKSLVLKRTSPSATPPVYPAFARLGDIFPAILLTSNLGQSCSANSGFLVSRGPSPCPSVEPSEPQIASLAVATICEPVYLPPVNPHLVVQTDHRNPIASTPPLTTRRRNPTAHGTCPHPLLPTDSYRRRALPAFTIVQLLFAVIFDVFAEVPS